MSRSKRVSSVSVALVASITTFGCGKVQPTSETDAGVAAMPQHAPAIEIAHSVRFERSEGGVVTRFDPIDTLPAKHRATVTYPTTAERATEVSAPGVAVRFRMLGAAAKSIAIEGEQVLYRGALAGADIVHVPSRGGTEDFVRFPAKPGENVLRWTFDTTGVAGLRLTDSVLELVDASGAPRLRVGRPVAIDARGKRRDGTLAVEGCAVDTNPAVPWGRTFTPPSESGCVLVARWDDHGLDYPLTVDPAWTTTGSLAFARGSHAAASVQGAGTCSAGCVVVVGGNGPSGAVTTPEVYSVSSGTFANAPLPGGVNFTGVTNIAAADATGGMAVFAGGWASDGTTATNHAITWSTSAGWAQTYDLDTPRAGAVMGTIPNWGALIVGGDTGSVASNVPMYFFRYGSPAPGWVYPGASYRLSTGRISPLLAIYTFYTSPYTNWAACAIGGTDWSYNPLLSADCAYFDPSAPSKYYDFTTWKSFPTALTKARTVLAMVGSRGFATSSEGGIDMVDMTNVRGAILGGFCSPSCPVSFGLLPTLKTTGVTPRMGASAGTDRALFIGGGSVSSASSTVDYFTPGANPLGSTGSLTFGSLVTGRYNGTATTLPDGRVLVAGGLKAYSSYTASAEIFGIQAKGGSCGATGECAAGLTCADGVCCDTTGASKPGCSDTCESCVVPGKVGTCSPAASRTLPAVGHTACSSPMGGACGYACDGVNRTACAVAGTSASCAAASCVDGSGPSTFTAQSFCDSSGSCAYATPGDCGKYKCASATACKAGCTTNADCTSGNKCSGGACVDAGDRGASCTTTGDCLPGKGLTCVDGVCCSVSSCPTGFSCAVGGGFCKKPLGGTCTAATASDCGSGFCAPEGVCCNTACVGQCEECKAAGSIGTCTPRPALSDPTGGRTACGGTGECRATCDGTTRNACGPYPNKLKSCGAASCSTVTYTAQAASFCDGSGTCVPGAKTTCNPYKCGGTACAATCLSTADCQTGYFCDTTKSQCVTSGDNGTACTDKSECKSGNCVDGVCCATATCAMGLTCAANGKGTCSKPLGATCSAATECGSGFCADGVCCNAACTGACESCTLTGYKGSCTPVPSGGDAAHGTCPGTGACRAKCDGTTRAACGPLPGVSTACAAASCADSKLTGISYCDGLGSCSTPAPSTCAPYVCASTSACGLSCTTATDCATGYACKAGKCETTGDLGTLCDDASQCKSGKCAPAVTAGKTVCCSVDSCPTGTYCGEAGTPGAGTCVKRNGSTCGDPNECASGFCVDGVCCDAACSGQCQACDVAGARGKCSAVLGAPHGSRPKCSDGAGDVCKAQACDGSDAVKCAAFVNGPAVECGRSCADDGTVAVSKCDGAGTCATPKNSSCAGFKCDGGACKTTCAANSDCSTGYYCNAATARCEPALGKCSDDRTKSTSADGTQVLDCAPYKCDPGSGGCGKQCASTDNDCATGFLCSEGACVPAPSGESGDSGGCTYGTSSRSASARFLLALLVGGLVARRRLTSSGAR